MGNEYNISEKINRYYFFQKKIDCLLNLKRNPFFKSNGEDLETEKFYIINKRKVREWKENIGYDIAKYYLDKIRINDTDKYVNQLKMFCKYLEKNQLIQDYNFQMNDNDNYYSYCRFISNYSAPPLIRNATRSSLWAVRGASRLARPMNSQKSSGE